MSKSLLEQMPGIVAAGKRQAAQIREQLEGRNRVSLQTRELVIPSKDRGGSALNDENVQRKQKAALAWCEQINELPEEDRDSRRWDYVLLGESVIIEWNKKNASVTDLLEYARLRRTSTAKQERLL